jgi:hypothetical protein
MSSSSSQLTAPLNKQITITKDNFCGSPSKNFYGSPSKKSPCKTTKNPSPVNIKSISSFGSRLKGSSTSNSSRDLFSSDDNNSQLSRQAQVGQNTLLSNEPTSTTNTSNPNSFLFSPMKRLRIEEYVLEKPEDTTINNTTFNNTTFNDTTLNNIASLSSSSNSTTISCEMNLVTPPKTNNNMPFLGSNSQLLNDNSSPIRIMYMDTKKVTTPYKQNTTPKKKNPFNVIWSKI